MLMLDLLQPTRVFYCAQEGAHQELGFLLARSLKRQPVLTYVAVVVGDERILVARKGPSSCGLELMNTEHCRSQRMADLL